MEVPEQVLQDMLTYVEKSSALLEETGRVQVEMHRRAPALADSLVKAGLLDSNAREAAIQKLQEPISVMESLQKTAEFINQSVPRMGEPANKEASDNKKDTNVNIKESDRAYYARLGFNVA
jgi:hypothetical protein